MPKMQQSVRKRKRSNTEVRLRSDKEELSYDLLYIEILTLKNRVSALECLVRGYEYRPIVVNPPTNDVSTKC